MNKLKQLLGIVFQLTSPYFKAIVGFVVGSIVAWIAKNGASLDPSAVSGLEAFLNGLLVAIAVYFVPNRKV